MATRSLIAADASSTSPRTLYELRIYTAIAGKLGELQAVMGGQGMRRFAKHGIQNIFDDTLLEGAPIDRSDASNMLVCILAHDSHAAAEKSWAAFDADPAEQQAWANAEKGGALSARPLVYIVMNATEFSPALEAPTVAGAPKKIFELRKYNTGSDRLQTTVDEFEHGLGAILVKVGMPSFCCRRCFISAKYTCNARSQRVSVLR